jgi:hypothetical protein
MPLYRVNVLQSEVSIVIHQVEIEAETPEHAAIFASMGIAKREFWSDDQVLKTRTRRHSPEKYAVMLAAPLIEMEKAQQDKWKKERKRFKTWDGESETVTFPEIEG